MDILETVQQKTTDMTKGLDHHFYKERLREQEPGEEKAQGGFCDVQVTEHWHRLPRVLVESASLEVFKTQLVAFLCDLLQRTCFRRGIGLNDR